MIEIDLEDFEDFYRDRINTKYFKIKKKSKKFIYDIRTSLVDLKVCMDHFLESGKDKVDEKSLRTLNYFSDRIKKEVEEIEIPEDIYYENINEFLNSIKKKFRNITEIQRKALPKFAKEVQPEIKELAYIQRKLAQKQNTMEQFLRKRYTNPKSNVKNAEDLLKKLPKLFTLKDNIEKVKTELDNFEEEYEQRKEDLERLNIDLIELEKNELFKELEVEKNKVFKLTISINDQLGFKKALKKLKFELEKETIHVPNINLNYIRDFLKNSIRVLINESRDLPKFSSLLVQLRHVLEENKLNLKTETKNKTIEQINIFFDKKSIQNNIEHLKKLNENVKSIEEKIKEAGLAQKLDDIKNQISLNTTKLEHVNNDLNRKNKDYLRYLGNLKREREELQTMTEKIILEQVKVNITFKF